MRKPHLKLSHLRVAFSFALPCLTPLVTSEPLVTYGDRDVKLERGAELPNGRVLYWMQDFAINCIPSYDRRWHVGHFDRCEFQSMRENTIALLKEEIFQFVIKLPQGLSVKALRVSLNGTFVFSVHREPDAAMACVIVIDAHQKEIFRFNTTAHLVDCALSEYGRYLALSMYGSRDKNEKFAGRLEVFDLTTGEVTASLDKSKDLMLAEIEVTEPDGNVIAFHKGRSFKVL